MGDFNARLFQQRLAAADIIVPHLREMGIAAGYLREREVFAYLDAGKAVPHATAERIARAADLPVDFFDVAYGNVASVAC